MQVRLPSGYENLRSYVEANPAQTDKVASDLRESTLSVVDYVKSTLRGNPECDRDKAFDLMDDLRDAYRATARVSNGAIPDLDKASKELKASGTTQLQGQTLTLKPSESKAVSTDKVVEPEHLESDSYHAQAPQEARQKGARILGAKLDYGAERHSIDQDQLPGRQGLKATIANLDELTPLVQGLLANCNLAPSSVGSMEAGVSAGSSSGASARAGFFRKSASTSSSATSSASMAGEWQPALSKAFAGLQELRDSMDGLRSFPARHFSVVGQREVSEELSVELPQRTWYGAKAPSKVFTLPALFVERGYDHYGRGSSKVKETLFNGTLMPEYIDIVKP